MLKKDEQNHVVKQYFKEVDNKVLLTREEETALVKKIEVKQEAILSECISYAFFRTELLRLLNESDVETASKKLNEESTKKLIASVTKSFKLLLIELEKVKPNNKSLKTLLQEVSITGNIVHGLVSNLSKKLDKLNESIRIISKLTQAFQINVKYNTLQNDYESVVYLFKSNAIEDLRLKLRITDHGMDLYRHDYENLKESIEALSKSGLSLTDAEEFKKIFSSINKKEYEMKGYKHELIVRNLRLVVSRAKRFLNKGQGMEFEDLIQEGNTGLMRAINKFDSSRGTKVATYATWWIDQAIRRGISNKSKTVRIPTHIEFLQSRLATALAELTHKLGRAPTNEELAKKVKMKVSAKDLDQLDKCAIHEMGLEDTNSAGVTLLELLPDDNQESAFTKAANTEVQDKIREVLATLPPRTEKIIRLRYGIGESSELTLDEIASQVGITKQRVRVIAEEVVQGLSKKSMIKSLR